MSQIDLIRREYSRHVLRAIVQGFKPMTQGQFFNRMGRVSTYVH